MLALMAVVPLDRRTLVAQKIAHAFRLACDADTPSKAVQSAGFWDHGQLERQLTSDAHFSLDRAGCAAEEGERVWFGRFLWFLAREFDSTPELLRHAIGEAVASVLRLPGRARTARATLTAPRRQEYAWDEDECGAVSSGASR